MTNDLNPLNDLIIVAGHAPFKETTITVPEHPEQDHAWVLQSFQIGEPPLYVSHIQRGVELLKQNPDALLIFSGGYTRREAGLRWSEAETYRAIARHFQWWTSAATLAGDLEKRVTTEDFSRDSFENLLFSICRFQQVTGRYPRKVIVISWAFKQERFDRHRIAIGFPADRFEFQGVNQPVGLGSALRGEEVTLRAFMQNRYGSDGELAAKRTARNPFNRMHAFRACPGVGELFQFIEDPKNGGEQFAGELPWV
jgi:hypothetical protein